MPITKRAIKKLRHDRKTAVVNDKMRRTVKNLVKTMRKHPSAKTLTSVYQILDKAAKRHVIAKNRASRLKSRLAKLLTKRKK